MARARGLQGGRIGPVPPGRADRRHRHGAGGQPERVQLKEGEVSEPLRTPQGYAFITVTGKQDPYVPKLDEVKTKVRDDVLKQKAVEAARGRRPPRSTRR